MDAKKPASKDANESAEVRRLILKVRSDEDSEGDAFGALMERYFPLIEKTVGRFSDGPLSETDREDLRQEALLGFYRAATTYDLSQERVSFGLYAQICMTNRLISCVRRMKHREEEQPLSLDAETAMSAEERSVLDPVQSLAAKERLESTYAVIRRVLSPFEYTVWEYYARGNTAKEIADRLGKSEKSVSNAIGRIRGKLRAARAEFDF